MQTLTKIDDWEREYQAGIAPLGHDVLQPYEVPIWQGIFKQLLPKIPGGKIIEIGSAPGTFSMRMAKMLHGEPFGVEYTPSGASINRAAFSAAGYDPANVIEADFFAPEFLSAHKDLYDVVMSFGFIEHFGDPTTVVMRHVELIKPGGYLVIGVPNFQGLYGKLFPYFKPEIPATHNMSIMDTKNFEELFVPAKLETLFCGYSGRWHFCFRETTSSRIKRFIQLGLMNIEPALHGVLNMLPQHFKLESTFFSPNLIYVGRRAPF